MTFGEERKETLGKRTRDGQEYATELQLFYKKLEDFRLTLGISAF